ncbi:response regulator transcription factor [Aquimarina agarivorans]|uniref:response regulator transcription factor n=1 Tax=Aquimarina agarivorans TaxID=980584 RepID=UPI000248E7C5|nr:response regulator transcription factor [Aquimarina agarivorans]
MSNTDIINILMVDDHEMILEGYKNVFSNISSESKKFNIETSTNCEEAWKLVNDKIFDVVFLDINFPVIEGSKLISGEDLGIKIKNEKPLIKIVILTTLEDKFRLQNILFNINPDGFLLKGETNSSELIKCIERVIEQPPYYGQKISKILRSGVNHKLTLDKTDRSILYQLSLGSKNKDVAESVNLSLRAVENRKRKLKEIFDIEGGSNKQLLEKARESGYI